MVRIEKTRFLPNNIFNVLLILGFCVSCAVSVAQTTIRNNPELAYKRGLLHLERGDALAAQRTFQSILKNGENAQAHYGLGLVYSLDKSRNRQARRHFQRAVELNSSWADAWLQLAITLSVKKRLFGKSRRAFQHAVRLNPDVPQAWDFWIHTTLSRNKAAVLFDDFYSVLKVHPDNKSTFHNFIRTAFVHFEEKHAARILSKLCVDYPKNPVFARECIRMQTYAGKHNQCLQTLQTAFFDSLCSDTFFNRWLALNYFALSDTASALISYRRAYDAIRDSSDAANMAEDIRFICTADEWAAQIDCSLDSLATFYHIFWRNRDPFPSTEQNERLSDHLGRLLYVNRFCRRFAEPDFSFYDPRQIRSFDDIKKLQIYPGTLKSKNKIVEFYTQFNKKIRLGDEIPGFQQAHLPFWSNRRIDDMGLIILRCGLPDIELWSHAEDGIPECSSFIYMGDALRPHRIVHFVYLADAGWLFSSFPLSIVGRGEINPIYSTVEKTLANFTTLEEEIDATPGYSEQNKVDRYVRKTLEDISPVIESSDKSITFLLQHDLFSSRTKQIHLDVAALSYMGQTQRNELDLIYQLCTAQLSFSQDTTTKRALITKKIRFFTPTFNLIAELEHDQTITVPAAARTNRLKDYLGIIPLLNLRPGNYIVEVEIADTYSEKVGVVRQPISIPDYTSGTLEMSDILLYTLSDDSTREFTRGELKYVPKQLSPYNSTETINAYMELYNLCQDSSGFSTYTIGVELRQLEKRADKPEILSLAVQGVELNRRAKGNKITLHRPLSHDVLYLKLQRADFLPGQFELTIRVTDELSGQNVTRTTYFSVR